MAYTKTIWLNKSDPGFDILNAEALGKANLNKMEQGIYDAHQLLGGLDPNDYEPANPDIVKDANYVHTDNNYTAMDKLIVSSIDALSTMSGEIATLTPQTIKIIESDLVWSTGTPSTNTDIMEFNETNNTFTIRKAGSYNFRTYTLFYSNTVNTILATVKIIDAINSDIWHTEDTVLSMPSGTTVGVYSNKTMTFESSDLPKTLKVVHTADGAGMQIDAINYYVNTLSALPDITHNELLGTSDADCHPISAITGLEDTVTGQVITGESI